jgi:Tfp pilus assembly protein PilX
VRRGFTSVMAMLYLVLFSALSLGFYTATTMSVQVAKNERSSSVAQIGAESGLRFIRYQMGLINVTVSSGGDLLTPVYTALQSTLNGTQNLGSDSIAMTGGVIYIPSSNTSHFITTDSTTGAKFRVEISQVGTQIVVKSYGQGTVSTISRAMQLCFTQASHASAIFNYGVASKGKITTAGSSYILGSPDPTKGSVLSTDAVDSTPIVVDGKQVSGDVSITNPTGSVSYSGASIGGTSDPSQITNHIHIGVPAPLFPTVDPSQYLTAATGSSYGLLPGLTKQLTGTWSGYYANCTIPPNTNPSFSGTVKIAGVLYIKAPNVVTFKGNTTIQGVIIVDPAAADDPVHNQINFTGSVAAQPVTSLDSTFGTLPGLTGAFILAPNFGVNFSGDFGTIGGSIIASQVSMTGNAGGTIQGSVICVDNNPMLVNGSADIIIASTGTSQYPSGVNFGAYYRPLPDTYSEIVP